MNLDQNVALQELPKDRWRIRSGNDYAKAWERDAFWSLLCCSLPSASKLQELRLLQHVLSVAKRDACSVSDSMESFGKDELQSCKELAEGCEDFC